MDATRLYARRTVVIRLLIAAASVLALASPASAADPRQDEQWGLSMVRAPAAWSTSTGVGAVVAVIDSGVKGDHRDLSGRLAPGYDFVGKDPVEPGDEDEDPADGNGHGTHVTGIVAANRDNGEGIAGVAPGSTVLPIRVLDDEGAGYADDTIKAIDLAIERRVHVINLSLGDFVPLQSTIFPDSAYEAALKRAVDAGIVVVLAAGNNGFVKCENPAVEGIVCVGAVSRDGTRSAFSSFGTDVDLMAPGGSGAGGASADVLSTWNDGGYESVAGTSQAAPHVSAVAALLVSLGVSGKAAADRIVATAADAGPPGTDSQYGAGIVNAAAAVEGLGAPPPPADPGDPPPAAVGRFSAARSVKAGTLRKRGLRVTCRAVRPGRCKATLHHRGRRIGRGGADVPASIGTAVVVRLNRSARKRFRKLRKATRVRLTVTLPGEAARTRKVRVRP